MDFKMVGSGMSLPSFNVKERNKEKKMKEEKGKKGKKVKEKTKRKRFDIKVSLRKYMRDAMDF